jgi:hypothetical protein
MMWTTRVERMRKQILLLVSLQASLIVRTDTSNCSMGDAR